MGQRVPVWPGGLQTSTEDAQSGRQAWLEPQSGACGGSPARRPGAACRWPCPQPLTSAAFLSAGSEDAAGLAPGPPAAPRPVRAVDPLCIALSPEQQPACPAPPVTGEPGGAVSGRGRGSGERRSGWARALSDLRVLFADWRDPEFLRDVEAATGVDLGSARAGGRGRGKRRRHPGLTDLKQQASTSRTRIAKKIFAK